MMKTLGEVFEELSQSSSSYKFSVQSGRVTIAVDGLMHSLRRPFLG